MIKIKQNIQTHKQWYNLEKKKLSKIEKIYNICKKKIIYIYT